MNWHWDFPKDLKIWTLFFMNKHILRLPDIPVSRGQSPKSHLCPVLNSVAKISLNFHKSPDCPNFQFSFYIFSLLSALSQKNKTYKIGLGVCVCVCVCVCVYICVCLCVCVKFWSTRNNFQTSYPIDTKFWLYIYIYIYIYSIYIYTYIYIIYI